jgi:hypothetical protein
MPTISTVLFPRIFFSDVDPPHRGKEALVEKFRNSSIMDEREGWKPKVFASAGPARGLPESFPAPTHLRRKQLSAQNRGALYVPGTAQVTSPVAETYSPVLFPSLDGPPSAAYSSPVHRVPPQGF